MMTKHFQVTKITERGSALYLAYTGLPLGLMDWSAKAEDAFTYDDAEEAHVDATRYGGTVEPFTRYDGRD